MLEPELRRRAARILWDCSSWVVATLSVVAARYDFHLNSAQFQALAIYVGVACLLQVVVGTTLMLYRGRYRTGSFEEISGLGLTAAIVSVALAVIVFAILGTQSLPRATAVIVPPIALISMAGAREVYRTWQSQGSRVVPHSERVLVYGAGGAGYHLIRLISSDSLSSYDVVGFIDEARSKRNLRLLGVPVLGTRDRLIEIAAARGALTL